MPNWPSLHLEKRIDSLAADAAVWIEKHPELKRIMALLVSFLICPCTSEKTPKYPLFPLLSVNVKRV